MKRSFNKAAFAVMAMLIAVLIGGCSKFKDYGVYDKSVPADQLSTLEIEAWLFVRQLNGVKVGPTNIFAPKISGWGVLTNYGDGYVTVKIPAGSHTLSVNFVAGANGISYEIKDLSISHDFKAGRTYRLSRIFFDRAGEVVTSLMLTDTIKLAITEK